MKKCIQMIAHLLALLTLAGCGAPAINPTGTQFTETQAETTEDQTETTENVTAQEDDTLNILMVGNSFCYHFCEELYYMLQSAGIKANVCNVYSSGCKLEQHWNWWKEGASKYDFIIHNEAGKQSKKNVNLEYCMAQYDWDVITLQESSAVMRAKDPVAALKESAKYREDLYGLFSEKFPQAKLYWQQTWAYQVGFTSSKYSVDAAEQAAYHERQRTYALGVCKENNVSRIPSGDAWKIVRDGGYDNLCARTGNNNGLGDNYHDGDIGGGQYLNACVWFERVLGQNCIGNTFRPDYSLSEDMIAMLQQAAHDTIALLKADEEGM